MNESTSSASQPPDLGAMVRALQPVIVSAPTARNGVTLLQRLLNSTRKIIVYGENAGFTQQMPTMVHATAMAYQQLKNETEQSRQRFLAGDSEYWSSNLTPDLGMFAAVHYTAFRHAVMVYEQCSRQYGFDRWGIKEPMKSPQMLQQLLSLLPSAKVLFIYRNIRDVARSAKARQFVQTPEQLAQYAATWQRNLAAAMKLGSPNVLMIKYEQLTEDPQPWLERIERFTGVTGIDASVMDRKINTFRGDKSRGHSPTSYIEPAKLSEQEAALLAEHAGRGLELAGYRKCA